MDATEKRKLLRNFIIELIVYAVLVVVYFLLVLRFLEDRLADLYAADLRTYAFLALFLIVTQSVALEAVTSFLIKRLGLERLE